MLRTAISLGVLTMLFTTACSSTPADEGPAPAINTSAADNLIPGQLARGAARQTEIRRAIPNRTLKQGYRKAQRRS